MVNVEKNDVDINGIFNWGRVFEIIGSDDEVEGYIFMRLLGDADVNRARVFALRKSREFRNKLKDENSDEFITTFKDLDDITEEELLNYVVMFSMRDIRNKAIKEVKVKKPKQPKADAPLEKFEEFQKEIDDYPDKLKDATEKFMQKEVKILSDRIKKENTKEQLYALYKKLLTDELCELIASRAYKDMEIFLGCFKDDDYKERFFETFEEYDNLLTETKLELRAAYNKLNMPMDELKKLREATQ